MAPAGRGRPLVRPRHRRQQGATHHQPGRAAPGAAGARRQTGLQRHLADRDRRGSGLARPGRLLRSAARGAGRRRLHCQRRPAPGRRPPHPVHGLARRGELRIEPARPRTRLPLGQLGRAAGQSRHRPVARHRLPGGRARPHPGAGPAAAAHPGAGGGGAGGPGSRWRRRRSRDRPRLGRARPVALGAGVRLEQPGRADLRRRRSGQAGQCHSAHRNGLVPVAFRRRHRLARARAARARASGRGRLCRRAGPRRHAGRRHPPVARQPLGTLGRRLDRAQHRPAPGAAAQPGGARCPTISSPTCSACPRCGCRIPTPPAPSTRPTSICWAAWRARAWPSWRACSGTWATRAPRRARPPKPIPLPPDRTLP